ncbi:MAG: hypothetical protein H7123_03675 [Thermoleophilia bacterium]|nr:hypothetical protein [Thermoleophilia bacterium]
MKLRPSMMRSLSPTEPTHWVLLAGALVAALVAWLRADAHGLSAHASAAMIGAATVFAAWALARELAPDRQSPAWLALVVTIGFVAVHRHLSIDLAGAFCVVIGARMAVGSTGLRPGLLDAAAIGAIVGLGADHQPGLIAAGMLVIGAAVPAFVAAPFDSAARSSDRLTALLTAAVGVIVTAAVAISNWPLPAGIEPPRYVALVALTLGTGIVAVIWCRQPETEPDHVSRLARSRAGTCTISRARLRQTRLLTTITLAAALAFAGPPAVSALAPAWFALAATGIVVAATGAVSSLRADNSRANG